MLTLRYEELAAKAEHLQSVPLESGTIFEEGTRRLIHDVEAQGELTEVGRRLLQAEILRTMSQRIRFECSPRKESNTVLASGLVISGLPRTKSTLMHNALADTDGYSWLRLSDALTPFCSNTLAALADADRQVRMVEALSHELASCHPMRSDRPEECITPMQLTGVSDRFSIHLYVPQYRQWCASPAIRSAAFHEYVDLLACFDRPRPWLLKAPTHAAWLDMLCDTQDERPTVVWLSREHEEAMMSFERLVHACRRVFLGRFPTDDWSRAWRCVRPPRGSVVIDWREVETYVEEACDREGWSRPIWSRYDWLRGTGGMRSPN